VLLSSDCSLYTYIVFFFFILVKIIALATSGKLATLPAGDGLTWCNV